MAFELVQVVAGGMQFSGWTAVTVRAALNEAARGFDIRVSEVPPAENPFGGPAPMDVWHFPPNTPVTVLASGSLLVTGYVDDYNPQGDAHDHTVTIVGRGRGMDYTDCSSVHPTGRFDDKKIEEIAQELDRFGVGVSADVDTGAKVPFFQIRQGSTPFQEILRLARQRHLTLKGEADGRITITRAGTSRHGGGLIQGVNIEKMAATLSARERFSDYIVKGQSALGTKKQQLRPRGEAKDGAVPRYRPKVLLDQADTDPARIRERAEWEKERAAGLSAKATITVPGWRDAGGTLWEPGHLVFVHAPWLKLEQDMLIETAEFTQDDRAGTLSTLNLVDPRAYAGKGPSESGSGSEWS